MKSIDYKNLAGKYLLLDSNVLINYSKFQTLYEDFFSELRNNKVTLLIDSHVKFEILRFSKDRKERDSLEEWFIKFGINFEEMEVANPKELSDYALNVANIYEKKYNASGNISLTDCFLAGIMAFYNRNSGQMYLATENHRDFPCSVLFNRLYVKTIDLHKNDSSSIHNIGIYEFDKKRFDDSKKELGLK